MDDPFAGRLGVLITHANGATTRWGPDEKLPQNRPMGISFSTSIPGGFKDCTLTLPRRIDIDYADLNLLDDVRVYGPGNETVWEGRVAALPRSHGDDTTISVQCVGWAAHLRDDPSFNEVYVDRDLSHWGSMSRQRRLNLIAATFSYIGDGQVDADTSTGLPALQLGFDGTGAAVSFFVEMWYDAGAGNTLGSIYYDFTSTNSLSTYSGAIGISSNDLDTFHSITADLLTGTNSTGTGTLSATTAFRYGFVQHYVAGISPSAVTHLFTVRRVAVFGSHGLTKQGTAPDQGFYASDVIPHILTNAAPMLNYTTGAGGSIEPTTFVIPQLEFREATTAEDAILATNAYHRWEFGVYDSREFFFRAPDPARLCWEARLSEGAHLDLEGDQADDIYNGVIVTYTDAAGSIHSVGPSGSGAEATDSSLADTDPENPVNAHGIPRRYAQLEISPVTTQAGAIQMGAMFLAEKALPQRRGQLTVRGTIQHPTAGRRPVARVRAGDYVRISDHPTDVPRRVIETSYSHDTGEMTMSLDNQAFKTEAILERLGVSLTGVL